MQLFDVVHQHWCGANIDAVQTKSDTKQMKQSWRALPKNLIDRLSKQDCKGSIWFRRPAFSTCFTRRGKDGSTREQWNRGSICAMFFKRATRDFYRWRGYSNIHHLYRNGSRHVGSSQSLHRGKTKHEECVAIRCTDVEFDHLPPRLSGLTKISKDVLGITL